jgi:selT/selW/selH-like putative selenoprotein
VDSELVRGSGGIFVVSADDTKLFSKKEQGRFPSDSEVIEKLRSLGL